MTSTQTPSETLTDANVGSYSQDDTTQNPELSVEQGGNIQPKQQDEPTLSLAQDVPQDVPIHPTQPDHNLIGPMVDLHTQSNTILLNPQIGTGN